MARGFGGVAGPEGQEGAGSSAVGGCRVLLGSCCCWSRREQKKVCPEHLRALTLAFLPDGVGDAGGAVARQEGPQAVLSRGLRQPVGRGGHVGQERPRHRGRGWPREASQGRGPEEAGLQQREGARARRHQRLQRAGQRRGQRARGRVRRFFLQGPQSARELGQPLGRLGRGLLLRDRGSGRQDGLVGLGGRRGAAGAVGADVQVLEERAVRAEAQQAVLTPGGRESSVRNGADPDTAPSPSPSPGGSGMPGSPQRGRDGDREQGHSLEVAVWFVVHLHVDHEVLHAGEGLGAAQRGAVEGFAWAEEFRDRFNPAVGSAARSPRSHLPPPVLLSPALPPPSREKGTWGVLALPSRDCVGL